VRIDPTALAAILAMALATYLTRIAGYWLVRHFTLSRRVRAGLEAVPGAILIALIAPAAFSTGIAESAAAAVALVVAMLRWPMLVALIASAGVAAGIRAVI
jgi:branched chain amino acid efflux pump